MSVLVVGECRGTRTRKAGPNKSGETWDEITLVVDGDGLARNYVRVASVEKFRGTLPDEGEIVALDVAVDPYVRKSGEPGYGLVAFGRIATLETALNERVKA